MDEHVEEQPQEEQHVGQKLAFRKRLLRMQAQSAEGRNAAVRRQADAEFEEWCERRCAEEPEIVDGWDDFPDTDAPTPPHGSVIAQWVHDTRRPTRDMSVPLEFDHPILKAIHAAGPFYGVQDVLGFIRNVPDRNVESMYEQLCMPDESARHLAYMFSIYLEVVDGVRESWMTTDYNHALQMHEEPYDLRRYAEILYDANWSYGYTEDTDGDVDPSP